MAAQIADDWYSDPADVVACVQRTTQTVASAIEFEMVGKSPDLMAMFFCQLDHAHDGREPCVPRWIVLGDG